MRTRDLKPGFFRNTELRQISFEARILFAGLWCMADRRGRLRDDPDIIKADVFPSDRVRVDRLLVLLYEKGLIERYETDGQRCIWLPTFLQHQHPHPNEPESVLPPSPSEQCQGNVEATAGQLPGNVGDITNPSLPSNLSPLASNLLLDPSFPTSLVKEAVASRNGRSIRSLLDLTPEEVAKIRGSYPNADINKRFSEWISWIEEEEKKRMPKDKIRAFMGWLKKEEV